MITQRTMLDIRPGGVMPVVHVSQYDNDAAALIFDLYDGAEIWPVPSGTSVLINGLKPDNHGFSYAAASISGNTVVCNLLDQMTAVAGAVICELRARNGAGTQIVGSANFILQVEPAALSDDTIISDTMIPLIEQAVEIASNLDRYITQTQANADTASQAATQATNAANSANIVNENVTTLYNSIEAAKTAANQAAARAEDAAETLEGMTAEADTLAAGSDATASYDSGTGVLRLGIPKGDKGDPGESGVVTPLAGFFTMYVDANGDLYSLSQTDMADAFEYDTETGNLFYVTEDGEG